MGVLLDCTEQYQDDDLLNIKLALYQPKVSFRLDLRKYIIQTATSSRDLRALVQLRRHSFFEEFGMSPSTDFQEFDEYDLLADHIILKSKQTNEVIGSYRILNSDFSHKFYSEEQFEMADLLQSPGHKIELSRACIHKDYRNGATLSLVWKGLAHYATITSTDYMFGCASIMSTSPRLAYSMYHYFKTDRLDTQFRLGIKEGFQFPENSFEPGTDQLADEVVQENIPPLLKVYMKAGARICSEPSIDRKMQCFDFLTILRMKELTSKYQERFF